MHPSPLSLNDFVDGELTPAEHTAIARHLETCVECLALVTDLEDVKRQAAALAPMAPPARVWSQIDHARGMNPRAAWHRTLGSSADSLWPLATAAALFLATLAGVRFGPSAARPVTSTATPVAARVGADAADAPLSATELQQVERQYQEAIGELETATNQERSALDAGAADTLRDTLATVDRAIDESRAALAIEPDSEPAQDSLLDGLKAKLALLQDTISLINASRRIAEG